jgi:hypothetical protein
LRRAAALAAGRYEIEEALSLLGRALARTGGDAERIDVLRERREPPPRELGERWLARALELQRLGELGRAKAVVAGPPEREPALLRLSLLRGDLEGVQEMLEGLPTGNPWSLDSAAARLDALAALGDSGRAGQEAAPFLEG